MRRFSKENLRSNDKTIFNFSMAKALKELEPRWKKLDTLQPYQWPWEFGRRRLSYIKYSKIQEDDWKNNFGQKIFRLKMEMALRYGWTEEKFYSMLNKDIEFWKKPGFWRFFPFDTKLESFGLSGWLRPGEEMNSPLWWSDTLNSKFSADARVETALCKKNGILNLHLFENEKVFIVNPSMPYQVYERHLKDLYKDISKQTIPQIQTAKFICYTKTYDLRRWGIDNVSDYIDSTEDGDSCISWNMIGNYLFPNDEFSVQRVKSQYAAAVRLINGRYMDIVKYKC